MIPEPASLVTTASVPALRAVPRLPRGAAGIRPTPRYPASTRQRPNGLCRGTPAGASCRRPGLGSKGGRASAGAAECLGAWDVRLVAPGGSWFHTEGTHGSRERRRAVAVGAPPLGSRTSQVCLCLGRLPNRQSDAWSLTERLSEERLLEGGWWVPRLHVIRVASRQAVPAGGSPRSEGS